MIRNTLESSSTSFCKLISAWSISFNLQLGYPKCPAKTCTYACCSACNHGSMVTSKYPLIPSSVLFSYKTTGIGHRLLSKRTFWRIPSGSLQSSSNSVFLYIAYESGLSHGFLTTLVCLGSIWMYQCHLWIHTDATLSSLLVAVVVVSMRRTECKLLIEFQLSSSMTSPCHFTARRSNTLWWLFYNYLYRSNGNISSNVSSNYISHGYNFLKKNF